MRFSIITLALIAHADLSNLKWIDSDDNPKVTYLVINECATPLLKTNLKDLCYVDKMVMKSCHIKTDIGENCEK